MEGTAETQAEQAANQIKARRRFKINLRICLSVNALIILAWAALAIAGVPIKHMALNLAIYLVVMAIWGARVARFADLQIPIEYALIRHRWIAGP